MSKYIMTQEEVINILQNIDPQCQKDCPISRDDCAKQVNRCLVSDALEYAADFLSADVVEVKHGEWIDYDDDYGSLMCSICEKDAPNDIPWDFCPNCGADMRGETK